MKNTILILSFTHSEKVVENFVEKIENGFRSLNLIVKHLTLGLDIKHQMASINEAELAFIFSIGPYPLSLRINGEKVYDFFKCPIYMYCIDNLLYDFARNDACRDFFTQALSNPRFHMISAERSFVDLYKNIQDSSGNSASVSFMPMAGFFNSPLEKAIEKQNKICIIGNPGGLGVSGWNREKSIFKTAEQNNRIGLSNKQIIKISDTLEAPEFLGNVAKVIIEEASLDYKILLDQNFLIFATSLDNFIRIRTRVNTVQSLEGFPVDFYGSGWEELFGHMSNFSFKGKISHFEIAKTAAQYQVLLNFDPNFEYGIHDRVFTALGSGTKVITNENGFISSIPKHNEMVYNYKINEPNIALIAEKALRETKEYTHRSELVLKHNWTQRITQWIHSVS